MGSLVQWEEGRRHQAGQLDQGKGVEGQHWGHELGSWRQCGRREGEPCSDQDLMVQARAPALVQAGIVSPMRGVELDSATSKSVHKIKLIVSVLYLRKWL